MRKGPDYLVWLINSKCRLLFKCEAGVIWITLDSDAWRNNFWFVRLLRHYWWWLMEMLEAEEYFFPSSPVLSLSLPHLLSHDSSKKYFITSTDPPPLPPPSQLWLLPFFSTVCPFSVFVFPPTASPDLQGSALALRETCWQRGRSWFLQLQLPNADSPCCQSDTLCLAFPRS